MYIIAYSFKVNDEIQTKWLDWIKQVFIPQHLATQLFQDFKLTRILDYGSEDGQTYSIQLSTESLAHLQKFSAQYSSTILNEHHQQFAGQYVSFQTVMEVIAS